MKINWFKIDESLIIDIISEIFIADINVNFSDLDYQFYNFLKFLKQGSQCKDCNKFFIKCRCIEFEDFTISYIFNFISNFIKYNLSNDSKFALLAFIKNRNRININSYQFLEKQIKNIYEN